MGPNQITYGSVNQRTLAFAFKEMLKNTVPVTVLMMFGLIKAIPKNTSETVKFRRAVPFTPVLTPLQEGVTPNAHGLSFEDVTVSLLQWGEVVTLTDKVSDLSEDPVIAVASREAGRNAQRTMERIIWNVLQGGTSVFYANGLARTAVNTAISLNKLRAAVRFLTAQKAEKFTEILGPSVNISTRYVEAGYVAVAHTDLDSDIRNLTGFIPVAAYGTRKALSPHEIGSVEQIRFILSPDLPSLPNAGGAVNGMVSTGGANADVYPIIILGMEAFGCTPLRNDPNAPGGNNLAISPTVRKPGTVDSGDPLGQRGFVGWKTWFNVVRLNELWMTRIEVGATAL